MINGLRPARIELDISLDGHTCSNCGGDTVETTNKHGIKIQYCPKCYPRE